LRDGLVDLARIQAADVVCLEDTGVDLHGLQSGLQTTGYRLP
jgi:hypothetical protein